MGIGCASAEELPPAIEVRSNLYEVRDPVRESLFRVTVSKSPFIGALVLPVVRSLDVGPVASCELRLRSNLKQPLVDHLWPAKCIDGPLKKLRIVSYGSSERVNVTLSRFSWHAGVLDHHIQDGEPILAPFLSTLIEPRDLALAKDPVSLRSPAVVTKLLSDDHLMRGSLGLRYDDGHISLTWVISER